MGELEMWPFQRKKGADKLDESAIPPALKHQYAAMQTSDLIEIITLHQDQCTPAAIRIAKAELRKEAR